MNSPPAWLSRGECAAFSGDSYTIERAWLRARELNPAYGEEGGRETFDADYRQHIEAGIDLIATLGWADGAAQAQAAVKEARLQRQQTDLESQERERRAEERLVDAGVDELSSPRPMRYVVEQRARLRLPALPSKSYGGRQQTTDGSNT